MSKLFTPTFRISIGLAALTVSLALCGYVFGLMPDESKAELDARTRIAEALAVQLSTAAFRNDIVGLQETISSAEGRNSAVLSIALRRANGEVLIASGDHALHWVEPHESRSTPTHLQVPLLNGDVPWGKVEITFRPLSSSEEIAGVPKTLGGFIAFLGVLGFAGYYFVLRRALRELDPSSVIPARVQAAFDTLAEGVLILDERERILLANDSFAEAINETPKSLIGSTIGDLKWRQWSRNNETADYPWRVALRDQKSVTAVPVALRVTSGEIRSFMVNATRIEDGKGNVSGTIATFDDVTVLERKNEDLNQAVRKLEATEKEISRQNLHLLYLASRDPLSGCMNRRAFFAELEARLEPGNREHQSPSCLMVDLDHFKSINDRFGHTAGDEVIAGVAGILKSSCGERNLVARYGGEEFCVALFGLTEDEAIQLAERIRQDVESRSEEWLATGERVTASIGVAMPPDDPFTSLDLVNRADQALYAAKEAGRNRVVCWDEAALESKTTPTKQSPLRGSTDVAYKAALDASHMSETNGTQDTTQILEPPQPRSTSDNDPLTRLPTRVIFMDRVSQSMARAKRNRQVVAVLHVSVDSFGRVAEVFGDAAGHRLITTGGERLSAVLRRSDTVSLVGGGDRVPMITQLAREKFAIEVSDIDEIDTVVWIVKRIFESISRPITMDNEEVYLHCSIGISVYPNDAGDAESLVRNAIVAERHARESGGDNTHAFFSEEMNERSRRHLTVEAGIRHALEHDEFTLHYQPIVDLRTGRLTATEALLRCENQILRGTPVGMLIATAEQTGSMHRMGEWALRTAVSQLKEWIDNGHDVPKMSVNISAIQLRESETIERLMQIVTEMDLAPQKIELEITETTILHDIDAASLTLKRFQKLGIQIALDDFGTGQSSLAYLRHFRPDTLKIDRSFIHEIDTRHADETLVSAVTAMSHRLGLRVVAEGVETPIQLNCVRALGCDEVQGFLIAEPMSATVMSEWLTQFADKDILFESSDGLRRQVA